MLFLILLAVIVGDVILLMVLRRIDTITEQQAKDAFDRTQERKRKRTRDQDRAYYASEMRNTK